MKYYITNGTKWLAGDSSWVATRDDARVFDSLNEAVITARKFGAFAWSEVTPEKRARWERMQREREQ